MPRTDPTSDAKIKINTDKVAQLLKGGRMARTNVAEFSQAVMALTGGPIKWVKFLLTLMNNTKSEAQKIRLALEIGKYVVTDSQLNGKDTSTTGVSREEAMQLLTEAAKESGLLVANNDGESEPQDRTAELS